MLSRLLSRSFLGLLVILALTLHADAINLAYLLPGVQLKQPRHFSQSVVLTFDDGPDTNYTLQIAHYLSRRGVPATFFLVGHRVKSAPSIVAELGKLGFELGNHSFSHRDLSALSGEEIQSELSETNQLIRRYAGVSPRFFRPPFGSFNSRVVSVARKLGMTTVLWTVDSRDWTKQGGKLVAAKVLRLVTPGSIILLHSTQADALSALPLILDGLKERGLKVVSLANWWDTNFGSEGLPSGEIRQRKEVRKPLPSKKVAPKPVPEVDFGPAEDFFEEEAQLSQITSQLTKLAEPELSAGLVETREVYSSSSFKIFTNISQPDRLDFAFLSREFLPPVREVSGVRLAFAWNENLPVRALPLQVKDSLLNRGSFPENVYPQPRYFLLTTSNQLFYLDGDFLSRLFNQGGLSEVLVVSDESQELPGDFGFPSRFISPGEFDAQSVFSLGEDSIFSLLELLFKKKQSIFIVIPENLFPSLGSSSEDERSFEKKKLLEFSLGEFLAFRQLTHNRLYDPANDLKAQINLSDGRTLGRFSDSYGPVLVIASKGSAFSLPVNSFLRRLKLLTPKEGEGFYASSLWSADLIQSTGSAIYLMP